MSCYRKDLSSATTKNLSGSYGFQARGFGAEENATHGRLGTCSTPEITDESCSRFRDAQQPGDRSAWRFVRLFESARGWSRLSRLLFAFRFTQIIGWLGFYNWHWPQLPSTHRAADMSRRPAVWRLSSRNCMFVSALFLPSLPSPLYLDFSPGA